MLIHRSAKICHVDCHATPCCWPVARGAVSRSGLPCSSRKEAYGEMNTLVHSPNHPSTTKMSGQYVLLQFGDDPFHNKFEDIEGRDAFTV